METSMYFLRDLTSSANDLWVLKEGGRAWLIGEDPKCLFDHLRSVRPIAASNFSYADVANFVHGIGLKFLAQQIFSAAGGRVVELKNRFGGGACPPFTSLPEARVVSAANGWPDPVRLEGLYE